MGFVEVGFDFIFFFFLLCRFKITDSEIHFIHPIHLCAVTGHYVEKG